MRLETGPRRALYAAIALLWGTAGAWWLLGEGTIGGGMASSWSDGRPRLLAAHGFAAGLFLLLVGSLWTAHLRPAWRARGHRWSGVALLAIVLGLALSGWGLYYLGEERWREGALWAHGLLGWPLPALVGGHLVAARRRERARRAPGSRALPR